jgi:hypothetical protein
MNAARTTALLVPVLLLGLSACGGGKSKDSGAWEAKEGSNFVGNADNKDNDAWQATPHTVGFDWVGVRPDLGINPQRPRTQTCSCLSVEVGSPTDDKFVWRGPRPEMGGANLALAISSAGVECPGGPSSAGDRRPSISGVYRNNNGDVVVEIEEAYENRPIATGAIIAPPDVRGGIFLRPRVKTLPYARPTAGNLCRVK